MALYLDSRSSPNWDHCLGGALDSLEVRVLARHTSLRLLDALGHFLDAFGRIEMTEDTNSSQSKVTASKSDKWFKSYGHLKFM